MVWSGLIFAWALGAQVVSVDPSTLDGTWIRVADGCGEMDASDIERLNESGGGNSSARREVWTVGAGRYKSVLQPSLRCEPDFVPTGPTLPPAKPQCRGGTSLGSLEVITPNQVLIHADQTNGDNPWGRLFTQFTFRFYNHGQVLMVSPFEHDNGCPDGEAKRIYFILAPAS